MKSIWKGGFSSITNYIRLVKYISLFREFWESFSDFISDFFIVAESFYKEIKFSFWNKSLV